LLSRFEIYAILGLVLPSLVASPTLADQRSDCTNIAIDYSDNSALTVQEQASAMEKAFYDSLNKYDSCLTEEEDEASDEASESGAQGGEQGGGTSGDGGATGSISGTGSGAGSDAAQAASAGAAASTGISGTLKPSEQEEAEGALPGEQETADPAEETKPKGQAAIKLNNGKTPDDIPASDNDSLLEIKIREAAENETDPETQAKLWNEYRKYKGLPLK
jgi:hypothetical protein